MHFSPPQALGRTAHPAVAAALALPLLLLCASAFVARPGFAGERALQGIASAEFTPAAERETGDDSAPTEYKLKAAVLYKFARYTRWPDAAFKDKTAPFIVAVIGKDPYGKLLEDTFRDHPIGERKVEIVRWTEPAQITNCHMLFVAGKDEKDEKLVEKVAEVVRGRSVLLITDSQRGPERSAHIGFYLDANKIRFVVNLKNTKASTLEISSELLKLAKIIEGVLER
jgi:hypothetical protein